MTLREFDAASRPRHTFRHRPFWHRSTRLERSHGRAPGRARKDPHVRRDRARSNPRAAPARVAAQFRAVVSIRHRLQSGPQPRDQRSAGAKRHARRSRHRQHLQHLHLADPGERPHRQRRLARDRRNQAGHGDDRRRRRLGDELFGEPRRRHRKARRRQRPRGAAHRHRAPGGGRQGDGSQQPQARSAAVGVAAGNRAAAAEPRYGAHRKPDRSAHHAVEPQILRSVVRAAPSPRPSRRASRCR